MKKLVLTLITTTALLGITFSGNTAEKKGTPYPLKSCVVSDEKLDGDSTMKPYTFTHEGQEVKLCCKSCLKDFKKEPAKYMAKIKAAQK